MIESILIRNAMTVTGRSMERKDVLVKAGKIEAVGQNIGESAELTLEGGHLHLLPGVLDPQVHFREPGAEWKEDLGSGSRAAAAGGVTSYFDMPNNRPAATTEALIQAKKDRAAETSVVNYNFFIGATPDNVDELNRCQNVPGIKIFMGSSTGDLLVSDPTALQEIFAAGERLIAVHAEDDEIIHAMEEKYRDSTSFADHQFVRPPAAALKATRLALDLSRRFRRRLHILHTSTADEVDLLGQVRHEVPVSAEVCPQHMLLRAPEVYQRLGALAQMNPPLRDAGHANALWRGLQRGILDCIATDHAPHTLEEKEGPFGSVPSGMPGVETSLPLLLNEVNRGHCSLPDVVRWMCENPVRLYGVRNKGRILHGYDADLVLVDMQKEKTIRNGDLFTRVNWSPYDGMTTHGWPIITLVGGQVVFREGEIMESVRGTEIRIDATRNAAHPDLNGSW